MKTEKSGSPKWQLFKNILTYTIICLGGIIMLMPFVWMVSTAFKTGAANMVLPPQFIPKEPTTANFTQVFEMFPMLRFLVNSVVVAVVTTLGQMLFCSMAAYAFARIPFWGRDKLFLLYLATMMVPAQVTMIPQFILMKQFGWLDSYAGLIVPALFSVLGHSYYVKHSWEFRKS